MIIVDLNQIMISNLMVQINGRQAVELSETFVRHITLNSLQITIKNLKKNMAIWSLLVIVKTYKRREIFPNYKAGRKASREKSDHDWDYIFNY